MFNFGFASSVVFYIKKNCRVLEVNLDQEEKVDLWAHLVVLENLECLEKLESKDLLDHLACLESRVLED